MELFRVSFSNWFVWSNEDVTRVYVRTGGSKTTEQAAYSVQQSLLGLKQGLW